MIGRVRTERQLIIASLVPHIIGGFSANPETLHTECTTLAAWAFEQAEKIHEEGVKRGIYSGEPKGKGGAPI